MTVSNRVRAPREEVMPPAENSKSLPKQSKTKLSTKKMPRRNTRSQRNSKRPLEDSTVADKENASGVVNEEKRDDVDSKGMSTRLPIDSKGFLLNCGRINRTLNKIHEHVSPKYTSTERAKFGMEAEYGGITGTLRPSAISRIAQVLSGQPDPASREGSPVVVPEQMRLNRDSVFLDIGSGTGRPVMYMASAEIRASVGFDIDPMQTWNSCSGLALVEKGKAKVLKCPVAFFQADVLKISNLEPVTHAYAFLGYPDIINATALLLARSQSVKVFVAVVLHEKEIKSTGLIDDRADITVLTGLQMPGGNSYMAYVIPMTKVRRKLIEKKLASKQSLDTLIHDFKALSTEEPGQLDISTTFTSNLNRAIEEPKSGKQQMEALRKFPYFEQDKGTRKSSRRAALAAKKKFLS